MRTLQLGDASHLPPRCQSVDLLRAPRPDSVASRPVTRLSLPRPETAWAAACETEGLDVQHEMGWRDGLRGPAPRTERGLLAILLPFLNDAGMLDDDVFEVGPRDARCLMHDGRRLQSDARLALLSCGATRAVPLLCAGGCSRRGA